MAPNLEREIARFDPRLPIETASTPPATWYVEPAMLARERETVFRKSWLCAGRTDQLAETGAFVAAATAGLQHVVVRDGDAELRGFHNVCRHHAARLAEGAGRCDALVCPYHGWTYGLDGALRHAPHVGGIRDFSREDSGLYPLAVAQRTPLVFVHADPAACDDVPAFDDLALDGLRYVARREFEVRCNWKVFVDNYLDGGYHVPVLHAALAGRLDLDSYQTRVFVRHSVQSCGARGAAASDTDERIGTGARYVWLYPNLMLNRYGPVLDTNIVLPIAADRTLVVFDYWFDAAVAEDDQFIERALAASARVQVEDTRICESVQAGLESGSWVCGRYAPRLEVGEHHFHRLLAADLT